MALLHQNEFEIGRRYLWTTSESWENCTENWLEPVFCVGSTISFHLQGFSLCRFLPSLIVLDQDMAPLRWRWILRDREQNILSSPWFGDDLNLEAEEMGWDYSPYSICHLDWFELKSDGPWVFEIEFEGDGPLAWMVLLSFGKINALNGAIFDQNVLGHRPNYPLSQYEHGGVAASRICSPTTICMLADLDASSLDRVVSQAYHLSSDLYGVWPQAIWSAYRNGRRGFCTWVQNIAELEFLLKRYGAVGVSVRVSQGELKNFPLKSGTQGHLLVLWGIENELASVADPAAKLDEDVLREYMWSQLWFCWQKSGGLAYILW